MLHLTGILNGMLVQGGYVQGCPIDICGLTCISRADPGRTSTPISEICTVGLAILPKAAWTQVVLVKGSQKADM